MSGLYSPINRAAELITRPKGTGAEYMAELQKKPGYKPAEAEDRDLQTLMALPQMERAAFMEKLKAQANKFPLKHRELTGGQTHHETYTMPGGENYREILLHTPTPEGQGFPGVPHHFGGTPNILASIRVKDRLIPDTEGPHNVKVIGGGGHSNVKHKTREDAERFAALKHQGGYKTEISPLNHKKMLHIEEIQSDWHQHGRESGYRTPEMEKEIKDIKAQKALLKQNLNEHVPGRSEAEWDKSAEALRKLDDKLYNLEEDLRKTVPYGPHAKDWHELALKAMIQHAAENGYDQIGITPGAEQAKRFSLSKQVGSVSYNPETQHFQAFKPNRETITNEKGATPERIQSLIGKEAAAKLLQAPQTMGHHYLEGEGLDIGGEGMKGFYDRMVPSFLNKFGKKHGVQVQPGEINADDPYGHSQVAMLRESGIPEHSWGDIPYAEKERMMKAYSAKQPPVMAPVHTFDITPAMREDVLKNGIPRYAEGGEIEVKPTVKDEAIQRKIPEMEAAAKALQAGTITRKEYDKVVKQHKPVKPYTFIPKPATDEDAERALMANKKPQWRGHEQWPAGRKVGLRLDIPAYENHGVWVNSVHDEEGSGQDKYPTAYHSVSSVKNATFDVSPDKAVRVATGEQNKSPFARIKGELHHITEDEAVEHMRRHLDDPDYAQVGMDPRRHGYFYDRKTLKPIVHSAHVVQIGPLVLAHKPTYGKRESYAKGGDVSRETIKAKVTMPPSMDTMQYELINRKAK